MQSIILVVQHPHGRINFTITQPQETKPETQPSEPFPTTWIETAAILAVIVVGTGLVVYFRKRKR